MAQFPHVNGVVSDHNVVTPSPPYIVIDDSLIKQDHAIDEDPRTAANLIQKHWLHTDTGKRFLVTRHLFTSLSRIPI